jgi:hypothetical protein
MTAKRLTLSASCDLLFGALLVYGYVYAAYKGFYPSLGHTDFFKYQAMVGRPFDFSATDAPFVLRQTTTVIASIFYEAGAHYDTVAAIDAFNADQDLKRRLLALVLSNGIAVCVAFAILSTYLRTKKIFGGPRDLFALFGVFAGWFYFSDFVIAPFTVGWGMVASSLLAIAFLERSPVLTGLACAVAIFSRETTLIFTFAMFASVIVFEGDRRLRTLASAAIVAGACLIYLLLRATLTHGYEHQIVLHDIVGSFLSFRPSRDFFFQGLFAQGLLVVLLLFIAATQPRYAGYLLLSAAAVCIVAIGASAKSIGMVWGETLPFYAAIFFLESPAPDGSNKKGRSVLRAAPHLQRPVTLNPNGTQ